MNARTTARFADRHATCAALEQLVQAGFPRDAISLVLSEDTHEREFGARQVGSGENTGARPMRASGVLATIVSGMVTLATPGGLTLRAAGPLATELLRRASAGSGVFLRTTALEAQGFTEREARFVAEGVRAGSIVVGVHGSDERVELAMRLLELSGGCALEAA